MIALRKNQPPQVLVQHSAEWTEEYVRLATAEGTDSQNLPRRYAHPEIRQELANETHQKCAYCESRIAHITYEHVEHILPKRYYPQLVCDWSNLTIACPRCNTSKGTYHDPECPLVNPYSDIISDHILFFGPLAMHVSRDRGRTTILKLDLNRTPLLGKRKEAIENLTRALELWETEAEGPKKTALALEVESLLQDNQEYIAALRGYLQDRSTKPGADAPTQLATFLQISDPVVEGGGK